MDVAARSYLSSNISTQYCKHGKSVSLQYSWTKEPVGRWYPNTQKKIDILLRTKQGNDCLTKKASLFTSYHSLHRTMDYFTLKCLKKKKKHLMPPPFLRREQRVQISGPLVTPTKMLDMKRLNLPCPGVLLHVC